MTNLTVLTTLWMGKFRGRTYDQEWVRRLQNMVSRNLPLDHEFICLTNVEIYGVRTIECTLPGWWSKIELFKRDYGDRMLFLDLDTVITGDLTDIASYPLRFAPAPHSSLWKGEGPNNQSNTVSNFSSCCMAWDAGEGREIWSEFSESAMSQFRGDQDYMGHIMGEVETMPSKWFRKLKECQDGPPEDVKIVASMPWKNDVASKNFKWVADLWI